MAFGIVLVVLIVALAVALLIFIIGYISQISRRYRGMKNTAKEKQEKPVIAPGPDEKGSAQPSDTSKPPLAKTD